jgi:hypothetical protein
MKYFGDIPQKHLDLVKDLTELEDWFEEHGKSIKPEMAAKGFVSMAHDYIFMDMEEQGERLLKRAEQVYPGYFKEKIQEHRKSSDFDELVNNLTKTLGFDLMKSYGFKP